METMFTNPSTCAKCAEWDFFHGFPSLRCGFFNYTKNNPNKHLNMVHVIKLSKFLSSPVGNKKKGEGFKLANNIS